MKTLKYFLAALFAVVLTVTTSAQSNKNKIINKISTKTETFKVWGNCDMCKTRIEKALKIEGVTSSDWSTQTKLLKVTFDPSKTSIDLLSKKLAGAGHDTEKFKAGDKAYDALPDCCKYDRVR